MAKAAANCTGGRFRSTGSTFTHLQQDFSWISTSIFSFFGRGFPWLYSTQMSRLRYSVHAGPACVHGQHQSCVEGLLFILYLLIITRLPSADHQSFIPHILTCASRVFVALAAALRNFCLIPSRLSLASHVLFAQMSFTLYLTNLKFFTTNCSNNPFTGIVGCFTRLLPYGSKIWGSESCPTPQSSPERGRFAFPLNGA